MTSVRERHLERQGRKRSLLASGLARHANRRLRTNRMASPLRSLSSFSRTQRWSYVLSDGVAHRGHTSLALVFSAKNSVPPAALLRVSKSRSSGRSRYRIKPLVAHVRPLVRCLSRQTQTTDLRAERGRSNSRYPPSSDKSPVCGSASGLSCDQSFDPRPPGASARGHRAAALLQSDLLACSAASLRNAVSAVRRWRRRRGELPERDAHVLLTAYSANGSENAGLLTKSSSVSDSKKASTSSVSCAVSLKPRMRPDLSGLSRPSPASGPSSITVPPAA